MGSDEDKLFQNWPFREGFLKTKRSDSSRISGSDKTALIRKGNEFFNGGDYEKAKRIFITTGYSDGLIRLGDYYAGKSEPLEAFRMYWMAPAPDKVDYYLERMSKVIKKWMKEG